MFSGRLHPRYEVAKLSEFNHKSQAAIATRLKLRIRADQENIPHDFIYNIVEVDCFQPLPSKDGKPIESVSCLAQSSNCRPLLTTFTATSFNPMAKQRKHRRQ